MNEVETLYRNAELLYCNKCMHDSELDCLYMCESKYPPFTARKQILLLQMLARKYGEVHIINNTPKGISIGIESISFNLMDFGETIAMVLNTFWQALTEEKQHVKGILE